MSYSPDPKLLSQRGRRTSRHAKHYSDNLRPSEIAHQPLSDQYSQRCIPHSGSQMPIPRPPGTSSPYVHPHQMMAPPDLQYTPQPLYPPSQGTNMAQRHQSYHQSGFNPYDTTPQYHSQAAHAQANTSISYAHSGPESLTQPASFNPPTCHNCGNHAHFTTQRPQTTSQTSTQAVDLYHQNPAPTPTTQPIAQQPHHTPNETHTEIWSQEDPEDSQTSTTQDSGIRQTAEALASTMDVADALDPLPIVRSLGLDVPVSKYFRDLDEKSYMENVDHSSAWPHLRSDPAFATIPEDGRLVSFEELEWRRESQTLVLVDNVEGKIDEEEEETEEKSSLRPPPPPVLGRHHAQNQRRKWKKKRAKAQGVLMGGEVACVPRKRKWSGEEEGEGGGPGLKKWPSR